MNLSVIEKITVLAVCAGAFGWFASEHRSDAVSTNGAEREPGAFTASLDLQPLPPIHPGPTYGVTFDQNVRPAAMSNLAVVGAAFGLPASDRLAIKAVSTTDGTVNWPVTGQTRSIDLTTGSQVVIHGSKPTAANITVTYNGTAYTPAPDNRTNQWQFDISDQLTGKTVFVLSSDDPNTPTSSIVLMPPNENAVQKPQVSQAATNAAAELAPYPKSGKFRVFGRYLRLAGERVLSGTQLQFRVFDAQGHFLALARQASFSVRPDGIWEAELELPLLGDLSQATAEGQIRVEASMPRTDAHAYAEKVVGFQVVRSDNPLAAPTITEIRQADNSTVIEKQGAGAKGVYRWNERTFWVHGTAAVKDNVDLADVRIALFQGQQRLQLLNFNMTGAKWQAKVGLSSDASFDLSAVTILGNNLLGQQKSDPAKIAIVTTTPRVISAESVDSLAKIKVTFSEQVTVPANLAAFTLVDSRKTDHAVIAPKPLPTLEKDNSLTLSFANMHPEAFTFKVEAAKIVDIYGNRMVDDFKAEFFKAVGDEGPSISRGITGPTGRYVPFPEYTNPRPPTNGFNPSDRVETRVARLYYYRDAHRVAQIINREVKSYNRTGVAMQRQLADKSRQIADQATDDRRSKERNAVRAAEKTREAERELQQAEQSAQIAAEQAANAAGDLQSTNGSLRTMADDDPNRANAQASADNLQNVVGSLESVASAARARAQDASNKVQQLREQEALAQEQWQSSIAVEDRSREEQFRREVAAAHADPDTYVPGQPTSEDPVRQVSVSVIGEGLIQLRGPVKGINIIRTMINQIDAPVGQVRIGIHSAQINGEDGERMEKVAEKIQRYIDHSRFLTMQSTEMLRKAIVQVAAQKAMEVNSMPGLSQQERDLKYLHAFYGEDFIRELEVLDSEFLNTGNKLLSLHSMNSTSLAAAMFNMALAKNTTRMEILGVFEGMMASDLPMAEQHYFEAGLTCDGKEELFGKYCKPEEFCMFSQNARFQSIRGFFNVDVQLDDTMTPVQREFVRLAQIFKSRLIVEMELKQRVMERSVIEERLGNQIEELKQAKLKEDQAIEMLQQSGATMRNARRGVLAATREVQARTKEVTDGVGEVSAAAKLARQSIILLLQSYERKAFGDEDPKSYLERIRKIAVQLGASNDEGKKKNAARLQAGLVELAQLIDEGWKDILAPLPEENELGARFRNYLNKLKTTLDEMQGQKTQAKELTQELSVTLQWNKQDVTILVTKDNKLVIAKRAQHEFMRRELGDLIGQAEKSQKLLSKYELDRSQAKLRKDGDELLVRILKDDLATATSDEILNNIHRSMTVFERYEVVADSLQKRVEKEASLLDSIYGDLANVDAGDEVYGRWLATEKRFTELLGDQLKAEIAPFFSGARTGFRDLLNAKLDYEQAREVAEGARRPLDHKKFLDMLVDDMEDKYIELLEGTRAYTANIDGYIKRLMTALDDDFNTQFYHPAFRQVRKASQDWAVEMGQVETTSILANNRGFAKVSPQATMEFDLPKRDILISEAINGAKAMIDDVGALANDPSFVSMAQIKSGQPTSSPGFGSTNGMSTVRNVLPGLSTDTAEAVMGQHGPGGSQFGSALESLIPDPAIYKFETGTGFEIRPVLDPDGQSVVFDFNYMYSTNIREPVRADEKHLGRIKRHFIDTDVQLANFELREISRYTVALKASRTSQGVPLLQDIPVIGALWRPLPSAESSLQQNVILGQATIFPTLFDLMGLRWAPVVADLDPLRLSTEEFTVRNRSRALNNRVFDYSSSKVDEFLRIPEGERRMDLYRTQETIPSVHPNGYRGPGANLRDSHLEEGYDPTRQPASGFIPGESSEGSLTRQRRPRLETFDRRPNSQAPSLNGPGATYGEPTPALPDGAQRMAPQPLRPDASFARGTTRPASYTQDRRAPNYNTLEYSTLEYSTPVYDASISAKSVRPTAQDNASGVRRLPSVSNVRPILARQPATNTRIR